jgi:uncharacterized protein
MQKSIVWKGLHFDTEEHCAVNFTDAAIIVRSEIEGWAGTKAVYVDYVLELNPNWSVKCVDIRFTVGTDSQHFDFKHTEQGWVDNNGGDCAEFAECKYVDISLTPFTNTLVINGLELADAVPAGIEVLYFDILAGAVRKDTQRYTKLNKSLYRFENEGGSFSADIAVDADGFVTHYPNLFKMLIPTNYMDTKSQIETLETQLIEALKTSNVAVLDSLLADSVIFTNHSGHLVTKQDDLETHRSGNLQIFSLEASAQLVQDYGNVAVVSVVKDISGSFSGHTFAGIHRYTRVWQKNEAGNWQVIAAHESQIIS